MLLAKSEHTLVPQQKVRNVLKAYPSSNNTWILIATSDDYPDKELLIHCDSTGQILWDRRYQDSIDTLALFDQSEIIVLNVTAGTIEIINLNNHEIVSHKHAYSFSNTSHMDLHTFYDSRLLCVQESGLINNEGKLVLTYYRYTRNSF